MIWLAFDKKQVDSVDSTPSSLFSHKLQTAVGSLLRMKFCLKLTCKKKTAAECTEEKIIFMKKDLINILAPGSI